ncbi:MAG TPA: 5'/3'-nucleotidase SurE [Bacteroidales bacterium]|nr:5'/3'-nucleotidase SurE [Bacteroidales bacterium]
MDKDRLILITNDDGIHAKGIEALVNVAKSFGNVVVVAPTEGQSGMSHAITVKTPIRVYKHGKNGNVEKFSCNGTPVDCVKMAMSKILPKEPDLILSGINHGGNSSSSVLYSGTMAAALEGCLYGIPSVGFSLLEFSKDADFSAATFFVNRIIDNILRRGLPKGVCLNVNIPYLKAEQIKGVMVCRQNHGIWREEFEHRTDPAGHDYYWLTGTFEDLEPHATDTDEWALRNQYIAITPVQFDFTAHKALHTLKQWNWNDGTTD